ncbi:UNVERIFIED_ORG: hypothetical protein J2W85_002030 [Ensifer adhaerens]|jgi:hypothetical protein|nr:hypothetical protein [Ensifer adhaerens]
MSCKPERPVQVNTNAKRPRLFRGLCIGKVQILAPGAARDAFDLFTHQPFNQGR